MKPDDPPIVTHNVPCGGFLRPCEVCGKVRYCGREGNCLDCMESGHIVRRRFCIDVDIYTVPCPDCGGHKGYVEKPTRLLREGDDIGYGIVDRIEMRENDNDPVVWYWQQNNEGGRTLQGPLHAGSTLKVYHSADHRCLKCNGNGVVGLPGWTRGERWNGWACPLFEKAEMLLIVAETEGMTFDEATQDVTWRNPSYEDDYANGEEPEKWEGTIVKTPEGDKLIWAIGAWSWCWDADEM